MGADYLFYVKSIANYAPAFFVYNNSVLARVRTKKNYNFFYLTVGIFLKIKLQWLLLMPLQKDEHKT